MLFALDGVVNVNDKNQLIVIGGNFIKVDKNLLVIAFAFAG